MEWKLVDPMQTRIWNTKQDDGSFSLQEGDILEGTYIRVKTDVGPNASKLYTIRTNEGEEVGVWGGTLLDSRLETLPFGAQVKIVYKGKVKSPKTGRNYHNYEVYSAVPDPQEGLPVEAHEEDILAEQQEE